MSKRLRIGGALLAVAVALALGVASPQADPALRQAPVARPGPPPIPPPRVRDPEHELPRADELVSSFTTRYTAGEPRVLNIQRAAALLDGTVLPPGETFSMNEALGERTVGRGFVPAPMISGGRVVDSVGGGISQVATTLYNAAFFGGLELIRHTAHSFYIDRYPMGREATISWGGPELVFRNDWPAPVRMRLLTTSTSVTARFYSAVLGRRVETETSKPFAYVAPRTVFVTNLALPPGTQIRVQDAGEPGFTVEYTRRVYRYGDLLRNERFRTRYEPKNAIVETGPSRVGGP